MTVTKVLGIDLASSWSNLGSALLAFDADGRIVDVRAGVVAWPKARFTPHVLASVVDRFAREHQVRTVSFDGPQGWRDPETNPTLPGVGRRCDLESRTQGKVGVRPQTWPSNQRPWIEHCVETFAALLSLPSVTLAEEVGVAASPDGYLVAECYPTSTWRTAGLRPLASKAKRPNLSEYYEALARRFTLPATTVLSHDDLQAVVAAITAAAAAGALSLEPVLRGVRSRTLESDDGTAVRVEGIIWDARPRGNASHVDSPIAPGTTELDAAPVARVDGPCAYVTPRVVAHVVSGGGVAQRQIALRGYPGATGDRRVRVRFSVAESAHALLIGDSHAAWWTHQDDEETRTSFETLFAMLADRPGHEHSVSELEVVR